MTEPKKLAPLRILQILYKHSSPEHPLWQEEIQRYLLRDYGIELERKAIGRDVSLLTAVGFDIDVIPKCGCYLSSRVFDDDELRLLIDAVLSSERIAKAHSEALVEKLKNLSNKFFHFDFGEVEVVGERDEDGTKPLFDILSNINRAVSRGGQIEFDYEEKDGSCAPNHFRVISRRLLLHKGVYYLLAYNGERLAFYRLDRMSNVSFPWFENDWLPDPGRDLKAEESAIEAFFHGDVQDGA